MSNGKVLTAKKDIDFKEIDKKTNKTRHREHLAIVSENCGYDTFSEMMYDEHMLRGKTATQISRLINRKYKEHCKKEGLETGNISTRDTIRYFLETRMGVYKPLRTFKKKPIDGAKKQCHVPGCTASVAPGNYWLCHQHARVSEEVIY